MGPTMLLGVEGGALPRKYIPLSHVYFGLGLHMM